MKFMVCYDGTASAKKALSLAKERAEIVNASIHVVASLFGSEHQQIKEIEKAEKDLAYARVMFKGEKTACETTLLTGHSDAGENLVRFAVENQIDEIFIGIVMKSKVGKLFFGSTAQYVILKAPCPVVSVHG